MRLYQKGFTLFELIFVLGMVACICMFALPDNNQLYKKNELVLLEENLSASLRYAKITALAQGKELFLAPLEAKNWASGIALYTQKEKKLLYQWCWKFPGWQVSWKGFRGDEYLPIAVNPQNFAINGQFNLLHKATGDRVFLSVNRLGRIVLPAK